MPTIEDTLCSTPRSIFQCLVHGVELLSHQGKAELEIQISPSNQCLIDHQSKAQWLEYMKSRNSGKKNSPLKNTSSCKTGWSALLSEAAINQTPFRYASGGALPVVKKEGQLYFMMFYRDIFPEGWNIANGSSSDLEDLMNPQRIIHREFHEELMVVNRETKQLVYFQNPITPLGSEFINARLAWQKRLGVTLSPDKKPISWIPGPDQIRVKYNNAKIVKTNGYFLSVTPEDFSIEVDKIVNFELQKNESLIDGELFNNRLINRLIGLFRIESLAADLEQNTKQFIPEIFFYSGIEYSQKDFNEIFKQSQKDHRWKHSTPSQPLSKQLPLCPITESIINQAMAQNIKF